MSSNQFDIYTSPDGLSEIEVHFDGDTCWLSLNQLAELFQRDKSVISRHLRNIYQQNEVDPSATVARNATVQLVSGRRVMRTVRYYNLDVILSVGYRVNSKQGTRFRQWATRRLREALLDQLERTRQQLETKDHELRVLHDGISILHNAIHSARVTLPHLAWLRAFDSSLQLIGDAACFLLFLRVNGRLQNDHGRSVLSNDGLAGLTLFVASSGANQMETVKRVIMSVLNRGLNRP